MRISIVGAGYVGLSLATLLSQKHEVICIDLDNNKVSSINNRKSPIRDEYIEKFFLEKELNLFATTDISACKESDIIIIATPTNYDDITNRFDTSSIESVISSVIKLNPDANIVIKSTIPIGYTKRIRSEFNNANILFSPEFLRESKALYDNLYPSRIIVGFDLIDDKQRKIAEIFSNLLKDCSHIDNVNVLLMGSTEAEAVKLFSNTYLAMRVAYFNELDTYTSENGLNTKSIIDGVCADPRIQNMYNNPSFGYGGYCLPKDSKQLLANFKGIPQNIISAIVDSNETRKSYIANDIISKVSNVDNPVIGIYRLIMKSGSDNFRSSAIIDVMNILKNSGMKVVVYEPILEKNTFDGFDVIHNISKFKNSCDVIIANRMSDDLIDVKEKVYTKDLYKRD